MWQWLNSRFDGTQPSTYFHLGTATSPNAALIGHNLRDTLWPRTTSAAACARTMRRGPRFPRCRRPPGPAPHRRSAT
jgi:hypothetical protein